MAVVLETIDLLVCQKIHGCGCVADDTTPRKSVNLQIKPSITQEPISTQKLLSKSKGY
jgi:hypothetical protein